MTLVGCCNYQRYTLLDQFTMLVSRCYRLFLSTSCIGYEKKGLLSLSHECCLGSDIIYIIYTLGGLSLWSLFYLKWALWSLRSSGSGTYVLRAYLFVAHLFELKTQDAFRHSVVFVTYNYFHKH